MNCDSDFGPWTTVSSRCSTVLYCYTPLRQADLWGIWYGREEMWPVSCLKKARLGLLYETDVKVALSPLVIHRHSLCQRCWRSTLVYSMADQETRSSYYFLHCPHQTFWLKRTYKALWPSTPGSLLGHPTAGVWEATPADLSSRTPKS